jgi:hypothetical protein
MGVFQVRWQETTGGAYTTLTLVPMPTAKEYPVRRDMVTKTSPDGNVIVQRPMRDARPRRWIWLRYSDRVPGYTALWAALEALEYRTRLQASKPPTVEIFEDVTKEGGFGNLIGGTTKVWTKVRFLQVTRSMASGGGSVYDESFIEFVIDDPAYGGF